ncbi:MAG: BMP family ABC transporter substrate-binding protein [Desulfovibrionaceae bacterium]
MRSWNLFLAVVLGGLLLALAGCGDSKPAEKAQAPAAPAAEAPAAPAVEAPVAPAVEAPAVAPAEPGKTLKVGFVYVGPVGDAGWSYAHDQGRQAVQALGYVETSYVESVAEGPDAERVIRNMARKGFDMVFATSFGYMDAMLKVAQEFPGQAFLHCSGFKTAPNMSNYFGRMYQARYLTGLVAGSMSKSGKIGYVAAMQIPEVIRGINAFTLGVRKVNPKAEVRVVWTNTWYDPALEKDAAVSLLDAGCDIITQHQDSPGPQEAAAERGAYSIGYNSDMSKFAPKAHLTAAVWNWAPFYKLQVQQLRLGQWQGGQSIWWGIEHEMVDIAPFGPMVPENVRQMVMAERQKLLDGNDDVFLGPIRGQNGEVLAPEGQKIPDADLLGMKVFVEGVVGSIN